jgi:hypothetical protein
VAEGATLGSQITFKKYNEARHREYETEPSYQYAAFPNHKCTYPWDKARLSSLIVQTSSIPLYEC